MRCKYNNNSFAAAQTNRRKKNVAKSIEIDEKKKIEREMNMNMQMYTRQTI